VQTQRRLSDSIESLLHITSDALQKSQEIFQIDVASITEDIFAMYVYFGARGRVQWLRLCATRLKVAVRSPMRLIFSI
jgi:hypothetical protein